jgi:hypothetical protein
MLASKQFHPSLSVMFKHALVSSVLACLSVRFITTNALDVLGVVYMPAFFLKQVQRHIVAENDPLAHEITRLILSAAAEAVDEILQAGCRTCLSSLLAFRRTRTAM